MAHDNYQRMMSLRLDGVLTPADQAALDRHLDECPACMAAWQAMSGLDALLGQTAMVSPPAGFSTRVMARVQARRAGRRWPETILWLTLIALLLSVMLPQWVPSLAPLAVTAGLPVLPGPLAEMAERASPALASARALVAVLGTLVEALTLWLTYVASLPLAWAVSLTAMTLAATLVGLVGVFGPAQPVRMAHDSRQVA
jgi:predicted anti-sigma-YlaC factor YlaD